MVDRGSMVVVLAHTVGSVDWSSEAIRRRASSIDTRLSTFLSLFLRGHRICRVSYSRLNRGSSQWPQIVHVNGKIIRLKVVSYFRSLRETRPRQSIGRVPLAIHENSTDSHQLLFRSPVTAGSLSVNYSMYSVVGGSK